MFIPNKADQDRDDERNFVQKALMRRFRGDQQLLYRDFPAFMEHPQLKELLGRYAALQDEIHTAFVNGGFGANAPEIALEVADPIVSLPEGLVEEENVLPASIELDEPVANVESVADLELVDLESKTDLEEAADLVEESALEAEIGLKPEADLVEESALEAEIDLKPEADLVAESALGQEIDLVAESALEPAIDLKPEEDLEADAIHIEGLDFDMATPEAKVPEQAPIADERWEESETPLPIAEAAQTDAVIWDETQTIDHAAENPSAPSEAEENKLNDANSPEADPPATAPQTMKDAPQIDPPAIPVKLNLPNGKLGVAYVQKIDITPLHRSVASLIDVQSQGFEAIGITFTFDGELKIDGTPDDHGKFPVEILLRFGAEGDRLAQDYRLLGEIDILPDPRKLWKEIEPEADLPYQKSHFRSEAVHMAGRTMIAASRRGRSHAHSGTFRDDEFELQVIEGEQWYVMAVADGAGSAPYSRRGSQIACDKAMEILATKLDERLTADLGALAGAWTRDPNEQLQAQVRNRIYEALSHAAYAGYKAICEEAEAMGETAKAFHTTLLLTIVRQYDFGYFIGTWWVGDGAVGVLQRGKYHKLMGNPDGGEYAGQTRFLTMPEIWADGATVAKRIEFDVVKDFTAVMLMSDGVSDPKFHTDYNMLQRENWDALWDELSEAVDMEHDNLKADEQLLDWLDFWAAGEHDDRTIAILF